MATHKIILGRIAKTDGKGELQLQIIHERKHREIDIGFRLQIEHFESERVKKTHPQHLVLNKKISSATKAADDVLADHAGEYLSIDQLKRQILLRMNYQGKTPLISEYLDAFKKKYSERGQSVTGNLLVKQAGYFDAFTGKKRLIHQIDKNILIAYKFDLEKKGCKPNTVQSYLSALKTVWKSAVEDGYISKLKTSPFAAELMPGWRKGAKKGKDIEVIKTIVDGFDNLTKKQRMAIEYRLLGFFIQGVDFIDLARLRKSDIIDNHITLPFRHKNRRKKNQGELTVNITKEVYSIINKYKSDYFLPEFEGVSLDSIEFARLRNRVYSNTISACKKLGIDTKLGSKAIRHIWTTHAEKLSNNNFLLPKKGLGHAINDITADYVYIDQEEVDKLNDAVINKALNK